ncbi:hypothetical protein ACTMU2_01850 [Cupriavidus basilensis]
MSDRVIDLASSEIVHIAIHRWPLDGGRKFSAGLGRHLQGKVDASHFYGVA